MQNTSQEYPPVMAEKALLNDFMPLPTAMKLDRLKQRGITFLNSEVHLEQMPTEANGNVAAVHTSLHTNVGKFEAIGTASPTDTGNKDTSELVRKAQANSYSASASIAYIATELQQQPSTAMVVDIQASAAIPDANPSQVQKTKPYNHSETRPASERQMRFVKNICERNNISETKARIQAGVQTDKILSSADANKVIQHYKHNPNSN